MFGEINNIYGYTNDKINVVSFSLWGENPKYTIGAIENAKLCLKLYPKWKARFYCGSDVDLQTIHSLKNLDAQIYVMKDVGTWNGMFWRFFPASENNVLRFLSRDTDSRITSREIDACDAWIKDDTDILIMRDHPYHGVPILGGMWGAKNGAINDIKEKINKWSKTDQWQTDQDFLANVIYPSIKSKTVFDPFFEKIPFPSKRDGTSFVGEAFDENGAPNEDHRRLIEAYGIR